MSDLATIFDPATLTGDLALAAANETDLAGDDTIETAVLISLFSDRRADAADELAIGEDERRGWWGDGLAAVRNDRLGSRLWLLGREKVNQETLNRAREYAAEALAWLVEDGVAAAVEIEAEWQADGLLAMAVTIELAAGGRFARDFTLRLGG